MIAGNCRSDTEISSKHNGGTDNAKVECAWLKWSEHQNLSHHAHGQFNRGWLSRPIHPSSTKPERV